MASAVLSFSVLEMMPNLKRLWCWWRGAHRESLTIGWFRYDVGGVCANCGKVNDGVNHNDDF